MEKVPTPTPSLGYDVTRPYIETCHVVNSSTNLDGNAMEGGDIGSMV